MSSTTGNASSYVSVRKLYLTAYNIVFASLWASVFIDAITNAQHGKLKLFAATEPQARWIQTASLIEVVHAASGSHSHWHFLTILLTYRRPHQITSQHHSFASRYTRDSSVDSVVQLSAKHCFIACVLGIAACVVDRGHDSLHVSCCEHVE